MVESSAHYSKSTDVFTLLSWLNIDRLGKRALLDGAICSFALHLTGKTTSNPDLIAQSRTVYGLALNELQAALRHPAEWKASETLCAAILLCYYELFAGTAAPDTWLQHAKGIGALIEQRGPEAHAEGWDAAMLLSCRAILIVGDIFWPGKDQLFLSRPAWKQVMSDGGRHLIYAADAPTSHIRVGDGFLSNLAQLSPVLHSGYLLREAHKAGISVESDKVSALSHLAAVNHARWTQWYDDFTALDFPPPIEVMPTDPETSLFQTVLVFQSPAAGSLLMGYWASMLVLEETLVQCGTPRVDSHSTTRYFVEQILRSLESVGQGTMGPYRVGFAVRIVYEFATGEEQRWIASMLDRFSQGYAAIDKKTYPEPKDDVIQPVQTSVQPGVIG
ncbi:Ff.00g124980.m01.CDS01 [Fusarium sp. VM40]|nr:Ff.00g124980.m01.CDS01 [Fusarium sp. VM40]